MYFIGQHRGLKKFDFDCEKGYRYVVLYAYIPEAEIAMDKCLFPKYNPNFQIP
jgi:hypothetical protein